MPPDLPLHFGPYRLDGPQGPLWHHAELVALPPKALAVLWLLASQAGQVVSKATLLDTVWAETVVSEGTLTTCLSLLRHALGEDAQQPRSIATVHRLGYRFVAPVTQAGPPPPWRPRRPARTRPRPRRGWWAARRNSPSCTLASPRRGRAPARPSSSRGRRGWAKRPWWRRLWRRWPRRRRPGSGGGSASTTLGRAKRICRCSTPWGAWAGGPRAPASGRVCASMPRPGWGRWPPWWGRRSGRPAGPRGPG